MWNRHASSPPGIPGIIGTLSLAILASCSHATSPQITSHRSLPSKFVEGSFVVHLESTATDADAANLANAVATQTGCKASAPAKIDWGAQSGTGVVSLSMQNTYNLSFTGCDFGSDHTKAIIDSLSAGANVISAKAEAIADTAPIQEDDPGKSAQGHLAAINRDAGCRLADPHGPQVIVAIVDSGIDLTHPDLAANLLKDANGEIVGANFVGSGAQMPPDNDFADQNGHGTHVAGLVDAVANNGAGVVGVAACANVKLMPVRVMDANGSGSDIEIQRGVKWAIDHGAQVINLSLGYAASVDPGDSQAFSEAVYNDAFEKNVLVFAAAGNDGKVMGSSDGGGGGAFYDFPAADDHVESVAATYDSGALTSFSNRGDRVKVATPGYQDLSTLKGGSYGRMSGTSMASPVAAGAYALSLAVARLGLDPAVDRVDPNMAETMLLASTVSGISIGTGSVASGGLLDAGKLAQAMAAKYPKSSSGSNTGNNTTNNNTTTGSGTNSGSGSGSGTGNDTGSNSGTGATAGDGSGTGDTGTTQPTDPGTGTAQPSQPAGFGFVGLTDGGKPAWPQQLSVANLPADTYVVYFFWGDTFWSFTKAYVTSGATTAQAADEWYLYGTQSLRAVAFSSSGSVLGDVSIQVAGY